MRLTKEQNEIVLKYILDCISSEGYEENPTTDKEKVLFLKNTFIAEYGFKIKQVGEWKSFKEWLQGLPSVLNIVFMNCDILKMAKEWGTLSQNPTEKEEDKILNNYWDFMTNKTFKLFKKFKI